MTTMIKPALLLALPTLLWAQGGFNGPGHGRMPPPGQAAAQLVQMRTSRLQQSLGIPEDRARAMAERWRRYDLDFIERGHQIARLRRQFNLILMGPGTEEEKSVRVKPFLDQFLFLRAQQHEMKQKLEEDLRAQLNPAQQARLILVMDDMERSLRETLRQALQEGQRP